MARLDNERAFGASMRNASSAAGIMFVLEAESENPRFDETTMVEHADYFRTWDEHFTGSRGSIANEDGALFKALHDIGVAHGAMRPSESPTLWKAIGNPGDEWPAWSQPLSGVDNPYMMGDKVSKFGRRFISGIDNNWYDPAPTETGAAGYGWNEVIK